MIASLARNRAWTDSLTDEHRERINQRLLESLDTAESARDVAAIAKALAGLERNDIERAKLLIDAEAVEDGGMDEANRLRADLDAIDRLEGRRAD